MCCGSFVPQYDFQGNSLHKLACPATAAAMKDPVAWTVVGTAAGGLAVLTWMGASLAADRFAQSFMSVPDDNKADAVARVVLSR